jgi:hypothetical protein
VRRHVREHKDSLLVEPATLIHANPQYALIRYESGKEDTVSLEDLSPAAEIPNPSDNSVSSPDLFKNGHNSSHVFSQNEMETYCEECYKDNINSTQLPVRRSERARKVPMKFLG